MEARAGRREEKRAREESPEITKLPGGGNVMGGDDSFAAARARFVPHTFVILSLRHVVIKPRHLGLRQEMAAAAAAYASQASLTIFMRRVQTHVQREPMQRVYSNLHITPK